MNVAVINIKDLFKYILKFIIVTSILILLVKGIKNIDTKKQSQSIKETINNTTKQINKYSFTNCLDLSIALMSYKNREEVKEEFITNSKILAMGAGIFEQSIYSEEINNNQTSVETNSDEEVTKQIEELPSEVTTEEVKENNIIPKYTTKYKDVKINNQSDYNLTEDMLEPNIEIENKKDILIYHTHTCESYTSSKRIRI